MSFRTDDAKTVLPSTLSADVNDIKGPQVKSRRRFKLWSITFALLVFVLVHRFFKFQTRQICPWGRDRHPIKDVCPQTEELVPSRNSELWKHAGKTFKTDSFKTRAVEILGGAVRIPTESYDQMDPVGVDPRWTVFGPFHEYLSNSFPLIHSTLTLTKVNTYGLIYLWTGSDTSLKPILFAAHQDVVPVNPTTVDQWEHPPFSGYFDGERIWGRGSVDDKSSLIGAMTSIEVLLENGFKPTRSVVLAFGFDEEISGFHGAARLADYLLANFGENGFSFLIDEGVGIMNDQYGGIAALPGIAEKGYFDVRVAVTSPGGHSSIPPPHTSIGILSALLVKYEANPHEVHLDRHSPVYKAIQCQGEHAPSMPSALRKMIRRSVYCDLALRRLEHTVFRDPTLKSLAGTTLAIDLIQGGVKTNALPEKAWAVVNHRIATESSVGAVKGHDTRLLMGLAAEFNLTYEAFGVRLSEEGAPALGTLTLSDAWDAALEPAPITPTTPDAPAFQFLSGTIKASYNAHQLGVTGKEIYVSPTIMSGNTDTRHYWKLTKNIFRYTHYDSGKDPVLKSGIHTVNESINANSYIEMIRFYTTLILNADESTSV